VSEHTFRPPYFHRNAVTEINGIISDPTLGPNHPFAVGCSYVTPAMTPHGVRAPGVEHAIAPGDQPPSRGSDGSFWFQFESVLPLHLTPWGRSARTPGWPGRWGSYRGQLVRPA
jgi:homogentisate 1,2-dioxygenase